MAYTIPGLSVIAVLALLGASLRSCFPRYVSVLAAVAVLMWIQGALLVWDYGVFDGSRIPWLATGWRGVLDTTIWIALLLAALYAYRRCEKFLVFGATATFVIQLIVISSDWLNGSFDRPPHTSQPYNAAEHEAMSRFSSTKNIFHVVMDGFQSDIFADIIRDPSDANLANALSGFTFYRENVGTFPYTQMSVPLLVSGKQYHNHMPADEFVMSTMRGQTILNGAQAAGFEIDIAAGVDLRNMYAVGGYTNAYTIPGNLHTSARDYIVNDAARLLDLALFRLAPHFVKAYIYEDELWFVQQHFRDRAYLHLRYFSDLAFLRQLEDKLVADRRSPVYKLFHVMLSHRPTVANEQCEYDGRKPTTRPHVTVQARCGLSQVVAILERMKALEIYDDSLIILMADHGAWVPATGYDNTSNANGLGPNPIIAGMAVPVLAIKPPGARGELHVSSAPTTIADVPKTIASLMRINVDFDGRNTFEIADDEQRKRTFFSYVYGENGKNPGYLHPMREFEILGSPFDYGSWQRQKLHHPKGATDQ